nr:hypothetical protein [Xanthomonas phaseoli]
MQRRPIEISMVPRPRKIRFIARQKKPFAALSKGSVESTTITAPALQQAARIWRRKTGYRGSITSY